MGPTVVEGAAPTISFLTAGSERAWRSPDETRRRTLRSSHRDSERKRSPRGSGSATKREGAKGADEPPFEFQQCLQRGLDLDTRDHRTRTAARPGTTPRADASSSPSRSSRRHAPIRLTGGGPRKATWRGSIRAGGRSPARPSRMVSADYLGERGASRAPAARCETSRSGYEISSPATRATTDCASRTGRPQRSAKDLRYSSPWPMQSSTTTSSAGLRIASAAATISS